MLAARDLRHAYDGRNVLDIDVLTLERATVTALVGPNGSGKSTLLRVLAFVETPRSGTLTLDGTAVRTAAGRRAARRRVTLVEQAPLLFRGTVLQNLLYALGLHDVRGADATARARGALERVGAAELTDRTARELSGGETQRVALARALALEPAVLLLDEPMSAGDRSAAHLLGSVLEAERARGAAICIASHRLEEAYRWSAEIIALADGRAGAVTPENFFRTVIPDGSGPREIRCGPLTLYVVTDRTGPVTVAIPPEDIVVSLAPLAASTRNQFPGRVTRIEDDGHGHVALTADVGVPLTARITPAALRELTVSVGDDVVLSVKAMAVRIV
jgi:tungstate transport system ATP-binding protein